MNLPPPPQSSPPGDAAPSAYPDSRWAQPYPGYPGADAAPRPKGSFLPANIALGFGLVSGLAFAIAVFLSLRTAVDALWWLLISVNTGPLALIFAVVSLFQIPPAGNGRSGFIARVMIGVVLALPIVGSVVLWTVFFIVVQM